MYGFIIQYKKSKKSQSQTKPVDFNKIFNCYRFVTTLVIGYCDNLLVTNNRSLYSNS